MSESRTFSVTIKDCLVNLLALGDLYESIATGENDNGFRIRADEAAAVMRASAHFISDFASSHREWVSVEERLPNHMELVVTYVNQATVPIVRGAYWDDGRDAGRGCPDFTVDELRGWWHDRNSVGAERLEGCFEPTHWMPLPSPPPKKD